MKFKYFFLFSILFSSSAKASECFVMKDLTTNQIIKNSNNEICKTRFSPCSSFKIPLSLIGFDSKVLKNEKKPVVKYEKGFVEAKKTDTDPHDPTQWMKNSCVWYSQEVITKKIGMKNFQEYIDKFNYGNKDLTGDLGKNNGLTHSWLRSSLKISPLEQIDFISNILNKKLEVSDHAYKMTKNITYIKDINGWKLHGKTGSCYEINNDGSENHNRFFGWFVGWIEKGEEKMVFAKFIQDEKDVAKNDYAGPRAKKIVIDELSSMNLK